ncbi:MAG: flavodoxin-dependent (E)-4-hydroxy-3-methylbut-2-enyl-diphosphate synthase [Candidatus Omnitrophota bacterium]
MKIQRRKCREIKIGNVRIGGNNPIAVQSMAKTFTSDLSATLHEIRQLEALGSQIVRVAVKDNKDAANLKKIRQRINIPLVADIHFDKNLALKAIDSGVAKIRLNPGNIYKSNDVGEIAAAAKQARIPIRVGVNSGSLRSLKPQGTGRKFGDKKHATQDMRMAIAMVRSALDYIKLLEGFGFYDIIVSLKGSDIFTTIQANEIIAQSCDYPLHLGVTATGPALEGAIKSSIVIGRLLFNGIGDTIRISLTDKATEEVKAAYHILSALGLKNRGPEIISCPTCGRCEVDLINIVRKLESSLAAFPVPKPASRKARQAKNPVKIAVMGCVVNGPGEAKEADVGIAFGKKEGLLFSKGRPIKKVSLAKCVDALLAEMPKR